MGKVVNAIFANNPIYGLITDGGKGFVRGLVNSIEVGVAYLSGGPVAAGLAALNNSIQSYQAQVRAAKKPDSTTSTIRTPIPVRVYGYGRRRYYGSTLLYENDKDNATVDVLALLDGQADGIEQVYLNDIKVSVVNGIVQRLEDKTYQHDKVKVGFTLGATPNTAFAPVIAKLPAIWTSNHRGDGIVTAYIIKEPEKSKELATTYPQGDNVQLSAVVRAQLCFDPRDGQTRWTENPVLHLLHYVTVRRGYDYAARIAPTVQYWIDAANICDEPISLRDGGTEPRYRSCVSYEATSPSKDVMASFLEVFDGWLAPRGDGALIVYAGKLYEPTVTIGPDEIINCRVQNYVENENYVDQYSVSYVSEAHDWNTVECTPWGGEEGTRRADAISPQSPSFSQNRRLAKRIMSRSNAPKRGSVTTNLAGRKARGHRYIYLDIRENGYEPFEGLPVVVEITSLQRDFQQGGLAMEWLLVDDRIDDWVPAVEEGYPAPVGESVERTELEPPVLISAMARFSKVGESSGTDEPVGGDPQSVSGARLLLAASGPANRDDLTWYAQTRVGTEPWSSLQEYPDADPGPGVSLLTGFVPYGANVQAQVFYSQGDGRLSPGSNILTTNTTKP